MTNQHPITPPPELAAKWVSEIYGNDPIIPLADITLRLVEQAARWGADQELQACINFVYDNELGDPDFYKNLRTARRPKPPTLKEQALEALEVIPKLVGFESERDAVRRALEALPND
jgi:hypothetical protein